MVTKTRIQTFQYRHWRRHDFSPPATKFINSQLYVFTEFRTGESQPKWRQLVSEHKNATTPLTAENIDWRGEKGFVRMRYFYDPIAGFNSKVRCMTETIGNGAAYEQQLPVIQTGWFSSSEDRARARTYAAIRQMQVKVSAPTFLGEMRQTLRQLRRPLGALGRSANEYLQRVKRNKKLFPPGRDGFSDWTKTLSESWLEYSFGWVPLLADIAGFRDAYNSLLDKDRVEHFSVGASSSRVRLESDTFASPTSGNVFLWCDKRQRIVDVHQVRYRGAVVARAATTTKDRLARFGFEPKEFFPTAWELLPWSFLIDYFVNIDDLLTASVTDTSSLAWLNRTERRIVTDRVTYTPNKALSIAQINPIAFISFEGRTSSSEYTVTRVTRSVGVGLTPPSLYFELPNLELSPIKGLNMAALLNLAREVHPQRTTGRSYRI